MSHGMSFVVWPKAINSHFLFSYLPFVEAWFPLPWMLWVNQHLTLLHGKCPKVV